MMRRLNHDQRPLFYSFSLDEVGSRGDKKALFRDSHHIQKTGRKLPLIKGRH
jgi:hypothetical protein